MSGRTLIAGMRGAYPHGGKLGETPSLFEGSVLVWGTGRPRVLTWVKDFPTTATYYVWQRQYSGYGSLGVSIDEVSVAGGTRQEAVSAARYFWSEVGAQTITQGSHHVDMTIDGQALDDALIIRAREYESISGTWIHYLGALPADKLDVSSDALANAIMRLNAPYATDMSVTTHKDVPVSGTLAGTDLDGEPLTYVLLSNGARGRVVIMNPRSGAFRYRPNPGAFGVDSFTYKIISDGIESNVGKVTVTIDQVQTPNQGLEREAAKSAAPLSLFRWAHRAKTIQQLLNRKI